MSEDDVRLSEEKSHPHFLWGYDKEAVYAPRISAAVHSVMVDLLARVWDKFGYCIDVCHATDSGHIELNIYNVMHKK